MGFLIIGLFSAAVLCISSPELITNHVSHWIKDNILVDSDKE